MEDKRIVICAGPGYPLYTEEQREMMRKALEEYQMQRFEEECKLREIANSVIYDSLQSDKETLIELTQRLKHTKNPMETIQIQREIGAISKHQHQQKKKRKRVR